MLAQLALYSDRCFMAAAGVYVLAMVLHGWEFARERTAAPALVGSAEGVEAVAGAGGGALLADAPDAASAGLGASSSSSSEAGASTDPVRGAARPRSERMGRMGVSLVILGAVKLYEEVTQREP